MFNQAVQIDTETNKNMWRVVSPASSKNDFNVLIYIPDEISKWKKKENRESNESKLKWLFL